MGVRALPRIAARLIERRAAADEPVAVVERGTLPGQRTLLAHARRRRRARRRRGHPRAGDHRSSDRWRRCATSSTGSSGGRCTGVASPSPARARRPAARRAAAPSSAPTWSRRRRSASQPARPPSCRRLARRLRPDRRQLAQRRAASCSRASSGRRRRPRAGRVAVAAIGPGTARALAHHGIGADVVPRRAVAEGLVEALADMPSVTRALVARAREGRDVLPGGAARARRRGRPARAVRDGRRAADGDALAAAGAADWITFTSASTVRFYRGGGWTRAGGPAAGLDRPGDLAPRCASTAASPTSRPPSTRPTAWIAHSSPPPPGA